MGDGGSTLEHTWEISPMVYSWNKLWFCRGCSSEPGSTTLCLESMSDPWESFDDKGQDIPNHYLSPRFWLRLEKCFYSYTIFSLPRSWTNINAYQFLSKVRCFIEFNGYYLSHLYLLTAISVDPIGIRIKVKQWKFSKKVFNLEFSITRCEVLIIESNSRISYNFTSPTRFSAVSAATFIGDRIIIFINTIPSYAFTAQRMVHFVKWGGNFVDFIHL